MTTKKKKKEFYFLLVNNEQSYKNQLYELLCCFLLEQWARHMQGQDKWKATNFLLQKLLARICIFDTYLN